MLADICFWNIVPTCRDADILGCVIECLVGDRLPYDTAKVNVDECLARLYLVDKGVCCYACDVLDRWRGTFARNGA